LNLRILRALLVLVCVSHLLLGLVAFSSPEASTRAAALFYGARVEASPVSAHLIRIIGAYMLAVGLMAAMAARDPARNRTLVLGVCALLTLRVIQRLVHAEEVHRAFEVSYPRIYAQSAFFALLAAALAYWRPSGDKPAR
jgi:hypothetical protein